MARIPATGGGRGLREIWPASRVIFTGIPRSHLLLADSSNILVIIVL
jgi:hypothetical protein